MGVNLVIATWSGIRRLQGKLKGKLKGKYTESSFIEKQVYYLQTVKHNLEQITFVIPNNPQEPEGFRKLIPTDIGSTKVVVLEKENLGMSYGSFAHAFETYRKEFDYYIFLEDDFIFVEDHFDDTLVNTFEQSTNCGYLCSYVYKGKHFPPHPAIFNGITTSAILTQLEEKFGCLPSSKCATYFGAESSQVAYGKQIMALGYLLYDLSNCYEFPFIDASRGLLSFGVKDGKKIIMPAQLLSL